MQNDFIISYGVLIRYRGSSSTVIIPETVFKIGDFSFYGNKNLSTVIIPSSVRMIGMGAFEKCINLISVKMPNSLISIGSYAFDGCVRLSSIEIPNGVERIYHRAFNNCTNLMHIVIPDSIKLIGDKAFFNTAYYNQLLNSDNNELYIGRHLIDVINKEFDSYSIRPDTLTIASSVFENCICIASISIPSTVSCIGDRAFRGCIGITSFFLSENMEEIGVSAFEDCVGLDSIVLPSKSIRIGGNAFRNTAYYNKQSNWHDSQLYVGQHLIKVKNNVIGQHSIRKNTLSIGGSAFGGCSEMTSFVVPNSVNRIGEWAFVGCTHLEFIIIPDSVLSIGEYAFYDCQHTTIVCTENSFVHRFCTTEKMSFLFDYQFAAFNGVIPPGIEKLSSPFIADEEKPFVFISYSHKDRDYVLGTIKSLYEAGWRIWYDEGLTVGDRYDEVLEEHVRDCSAFLLFVTKNSSCSNYIKINEIPWAEKYKKPVIRCLIETEMNCEIKSSCVVAEVSSDDIPIAFARIDGLFKGESRMAKGITVISNPQNREASCNNGFAYCIYSDYSLASAKTIILEAMKSGCAIYDSVEKGADSSKLNECNCLLVFIDKAFLSNAGFTQMLIEEYSSKRDIAVCQLEDIEETELPIELQELYKKQWLNYTNGFPIDMNTQLVRHLQKRGCRNTDTMHGFIHDKTSNGIIIRRYIGMMPNPIIEREHMGNPIVEIGEEAFRNCTQLKAINLPDSITTIRRSAFRDCTHLSLITIPDSVTQIERLAFSGCSSLHSINLPDSLTVLWHSMFYGCNSLSSITIPDSISTIHSGVFEDCTNLSSITLPPKITEIGASLFKGCISLKSCKIPYGVTRIGAAAFDNCSSLTAIVLPFGVTKILKAAFRGCANLSTITIPSSVTEIGENAFSGCSMLAILGKRNSFAEQYALQTGIPFFESSETLQ